MKTIRVMSHNLWRCDGNAPAWEAKGEDCSAAVRAKGFAQVYRETRPDVVGLQECSARMAHALMTRLAEERLPYALLWGRDTPVLYRRDTFELLDSAFLLYPEEVPGLEGSFNNYSTKSYCFAVLREKESGKTVLVGTTHLWSKSGDPASKSYQKGSEEARTYQMGLFLEKAEELQARYDCPAFILGDLNAYYASPAVQSALARGFVHAWDAATGYRDETSGMC